MFLCCSISACYYGARQAALVVLTSCVNRDIEYALTVSRVCCFEFSCIGDDVSDCVHYKMISYDTRRNRIEKLTS